MLLGGLGVLSVDTVDLVVNERKLEQMAWG